ncbi:MAG TPA: AarF/UbiB family protein [Phycisphaerales bacterium]|nr:AarF/UbiB family protein [Phycisphaerales bacterium]
MASLPIARRIQHVQRYAQVLEVLAHHGFADAAQKMRLDTLIERGRAIIGAPNGERHDRVPVQVRVRMALEDLGPTFVKLGQVLSTRPDLVPQEWADEFKKLQNKVPGVEYAVIENVLEEEFPGRVRKLFRSIQKKPLAAGSIAQVHRARLRDGTRIVLKVLRPGIRNLTAIDMEILRSVAEFVEAHFANLGYSPVEAVKEFAKELKREVDLTVEGRSVERLKAFFKEDPEIIFPTVYWDATTTNVLAMDEIDGLVLADMAPGSLSPHDRRRVVENGARAVFLQCLDLGFFHADPHPGNIIALRGGRIAFIDCGMTGHLDAETTRQLADLVSGVVSGELERVIAAAGAIADVAPEKLEDRTLRADVDAIVSEFRGATLDRLNLGRVLQNFFATLRAHRVRCPADIMLLIKALTTIESVARDVDPSFELVPFVRPYVEDLVGRRYGVSAVRRRLQRSAVQYLELVENLPGEIRLIVSQLRKNRLAVNLEHRGLNRLTHTIEHASRNISFALVIAAIFVGSSILVLAARDAGETVFKALAIAGFIAAAVLGVLMVISNRREPDG